MGASNASIDLFLATYTYSYASFFEFVRRIIGIKCRALINPIFQAAASRPPGPENAP
jgi:hypothetical protein